MTNEEYLELLLRRDNLRREAHEYQIRYLQKFGELILKNHEMRIEIIKYKKMIAYCQKKVNHGQTINGNELDQYIDMVMTGYNNQLSQLADDVAWANSSSTISEYDASKVRKLYYKLARKLHPDMNPALTDDYAFQDLWMQVRMAYEANDLDGLEEMEELLELLMKEKGLSEHSPVIEDLEEKAEKVRSEIEFIMSTDPYTYRFLLMDEEAVEQKMDELTEQLENSLEYLDKLKETFAQFNVERLVS